MFFRLFHKLVSYLKEIQDMIYFALMSNKRLFIALSSSPLFFVILPFIGLLQTITIMLNSYYFFKTSNKNFDKWFNFVTCLFCSLLSSISLYGMALASAFNFIFGAGPWLFFSSVLLAFSNQLVMLFINIFRAYESLKNSAQRMHYVQAVVYNLFTLGLLFGSGGAIIFALLVSAPPVIGTAFALTAVGFTFLNIIWKIIPYKWKLDLYSKRL